jgi:hypothetical protein
VDGRLLSVGAKGWKYQKKTKTASSAGTRKKEQKPQKRTKTFFMFLPIQADGLLEASYPTKPVKKLKQSIQPIANWTASLQHRHQSN